MRLKEHISEVPRTKNTIKNMKMYEIDMYSNFSIIMCLRLLAREFHGISELAMACL